MTIPLFQSHLRLRSPERPFSYSILAKLKKLDAPKRLEITAARASCRLHDSSAVINSTLLNVAQRRHGAQLRADLLAEEFPQLFAKPVDREALSR